MFQTKYFRSRQNKYSEVLTCEFSILWLVPSCAYSLQPGYTSSTATGIARSTPVHPAAGYLQVCCALSQTFCKSIPGNTGSNSFKTPCGKQQPTSSFLTVHDPGVQTNNSCPLETKQFYSIHSFRRNI